MALPLARSASEGQRFSPAGERYSTAGTQREFAVLSDAEGVEENSPGQRSGKVSLGALEAQGIALG